MIKVLGLAAVLALTGVAWCSSPASSGWTENLLRAEGPSHALSTGPRTGRAPAGRFADRPAAASAVNLRQEFALPPMHNDSDDPAAQITRETQVFRRAHLLNIDGDTADQAWATAAGTVRADREILPTLLKRPLARLTFNGTKLSELDALIATSGPAFITVSSRTLEADTALTITGQNVIVDFSGAAIEAGANPPVWLIALAHARNVGVINAKISGGVNGVLVDGGSNIAINGNDIGGLTENGIVVTGRSSGVGIRVNHLHDLGRAGIMLHGPVRTALVEGNEIENLRGHSNWNAGILLTGRGGDIAADPDTFFRPDHYWVVTTPLVGRLQNPNRNVIMANIIRATLSSGIYNDGAIANIFLQNRIEGNSKEGICFDNGATANVFAGNLVTDNGRRWGQSDADLALDSVLGAGRAADGTSLAKLPGISIDNGLYNEIFGNYVRGNFGGGVKMVRTGLFNVVGLNSIIDNNLGESSNFHFYGIELGAAPADVPAEDLDFVGSSGNVIFGNIIRGKHFSGIYFGSGSVQSQLLNNEIAGVEAFALESERR